MNLWNKQYRVVSDKRPLGNGLVNDRNQPVLTRAHDVAWAVTMHWARAVARSPVAARLARHHDVGWWGTGGEGGGTRQGDVKQGSPGRHHGMKVAVGGILMIATNLVGFYITSRERRGVRHCGIEGIKVGGGCPPKRGSSGGSSTEI
jgi:hypothetical protein